MRVYLKGKWEKRTEIREKQIKTVKTEQKRKLNKIINLIQLKFF
jgi:hypothetical protein